MTGKIRVLFLSAFCAAALVAAPVSAPAQDDGTSIEIQVDCGTNASYNKDYKVCFCDTGFHASDDGGTCVKDESLKKEAGKAAIKEPEKAPAKEIAESKPAPAPEPEPEPAKAAPAPAPAPAKDDAVSAPPPAPKPIAKKLQDGEFLLRRGTTIKLKLIETLSSQTHGTGDTVYFKVVDDVAVDGYVAIPADAEATGTVTYAKAAKGWGRSGQLDIRLDTAKALDGTPVPLTAFISDEEDWSPYAAGKTLLGTIVAGPLGLTIGGGMKGKKVVIEKGTTLAVFAADDIIVKSTKQAVVKKPIAPTSPSVASAPAPVDVEEQARQILKGCFEACKNSEGDSFRSCMDTCKTVCPDVCLGLEGDDLTNCLGKCAASE